MVRYTNSIIVPFARERVFSLMSDWRNLSSWDTNIVRSELSKHQKVEHQTIGVGTKYDCAFKVGSYQMPVDYTCTQYDTNVFCQYEGYTTLFKSLDFIHCDDVPDQVGSTKITASFSLAFRGPLSPLSFLLNSSMQKTGPVVMKEIDTFVRRQLSPP